MIAIDSVLINLGYQSLACEDSIHEDGRPMRVLSDLVLRLILGDGNVTDNHT